VASYHREDQQVEVVENQGEEDHREDDDHMDTYHLEVRVNHDEVAYLDMNKEIDLSFLLLLLLYLYRGIVIESDHVEKGVVIEIWNVDVEHLQLKKTNHLHAHHHHDEETLMMETNAFFDGDLRRNQDF